MRGIVDRVSQQRGLKWAFCRGGKSDRPCYLMGQRFRRPPTKWKAWGQTHNREKVSNANPKRRGRIQCVTPTLLIEICFATGQFYILPLPSFPPSFTLPNPISTPNPPLETRTAQFRNLYSGSAERSLLTPCSFRYPATRALPGKGSDRNSEHPSRTSECEEYGQLEADSNDCS